MSNTRGYLHTFLLLLLIGLFALPWQSATARWPDPPLVGGAPSAEEHLADSVHLRRYLPTGQAALPWQSTMARWPDPPPVDGAPLAKEHLVDGVHLRPYLPTGQDAIASSAVTGYQEQGLHLWRPLNTHLVPRSLLQPQSDEARHPSRQAATCTVSSTSDSGPNTLRQCLLDAITGDVILFDPSTFPPGTPMTITLSSELPLIAVDNLTIDASDVGVILDGSGLTGSHPGLVISGAQGGTLRGLQIQGFYWGVILAGGATYNTVGGDRAIGAGPLGQGNLISGNTFGVQIQNSGTAHNSVIGNYIGTDLSGDNANGNEDGVLIGWGASQNLIGGAPSPGACDGPCNLISGNVYEGVLIRDDGTTGNQVLGNFIGTNASGDAALPNDHGVVIPIGASDNQVGGAGAGEGNLISGNTNQGVWITSAGTTGNQVLGNIIGMDISGVTALPNYHGIVISFGASQNVIGGAHGSGTCDGPCNLISGNQNGVQIQNVDTEGNQVLGNFIGTDLSGGNANGNGDGVIIGWGASQNVIGGAHSPGVCDGSCNLISGNVDQGVNIMLDGTTGNQVLGNFVGTNASGDAALPNNHGVTISEDASNTQVGGAGMGEGNLISGNTNMGVWIDSAGTIGNQVLGNIIGTDISGITALPNYHGVLISTGSTGNQIGGAGTGAGNLISGNEFSGVVMQSMAAPGNTIAGNKIGTNLTGTAAVPNYEGISLESASNNVIGGTDPGAGNLISGNAQEGVHIEHSSLNSLQGNTIGTDVTGEIAIPNAVIGIFIGFGASDNTIGGSVPGGGNLISGNGLAGVHVQDEASVGNSILGNRIGTNRSGSSSLPNGATGVVVIRARETIIGGADTSTPWVCDGSCNLISGNGIFGVMIQGISPGAQGALSQGDNDRSLLADQANQVMGNFIGTDLTGTSALPNQYGVGMAIEATGNLIGGSRLLGEGNLISGNQWDGIIVRMPLTTNNQLAGNRIGTTADGEAALPNGRHGVWITEGASGNTVGGDGLGMGNQISGQATDPLYFGVSIETTFEPESIDNQVIGNLIGTNGTGTSAIPNGGGVGVAYLVTGTIIRDNVISGNSLRGIVLWETSGNQVRNNNIGVAAGGLSPLPNFGGVVVVTAPNNTLGPGNIIAYNQVGVAIVYPESVGNTITQNSIFANTDEQIGFFEVPQPLAPAPVLTGWDGSTVSGTACAGCQVEVFANPGSQPAGHTYLGTTTAAGDGTFNLYIGPGYIYLAATATDAEGTTSEFSNSLLIGTIFYVYLPLIVKTMVPLH